MKTLDDLFNISGMPHAALVRVDYNVAMSDSVIESELYRIIVSRDTIQELLQRGIIPVLVSHYGRSGDSIAEIIPEIEKYIAPVVYVQNWNNDEIQNAIASSPAGSVVLLPNSRTHSGEESCDAKFIELLAGIAPVYINDAFSASHRDHATITGVAHALPAYAGRQMMREITNLSRARNSNEHTLVIIGGAKFDTKMRLIEFYLESGAQVCVVGALAHPIYLARGYTIGTSLCDTAVDISVIVRHPHLWVADTVVARNADGVRDCCIADVQSDDQIVDMGTLSVSELSEMARSMQTVIWNGPFGLYEQGFVQGTEAFVAMMSSLSAFRVVGGGDTLACIPFDQYAVVADFCSTGGGAMLEFLYSGTLMGIEVLIS